MSLPPDALRLAKGLSIATVVTIMLGMNDGSYRAFDDKVFEAYSKGLEHICSSLKDRLKGVRVTLIERRPLIVP